MSKFEPKISDTAKTSNPANSPSFANLREFAKIGEGKSLSSTNEGEFRDLLSRTDISPNNIRDVRINKLGEFIITTNEQKTFIISESRLEFIEQLKKIDIQVKKNDPALSEGAKKEIKERIRQEATSNKNEPWNNQKNNLTGINVSKIENSDPVGYVINLTFKEEGSNRVQGVSFSYYSKNR